MSQRGKNLLSEIFPENSDYSARPRNVGLRLRPDEDSNEINLAYYYDSNEDHYTGRDYMNSRIKTRKKRKKTDPPKPKPKKEVEQGPSKAKLKSKEGGISISEVFSILGYSLVQFPVTKAQHDLLLSFKSLALLDVLAKLRVNLFQVLKIIKSNNKNLTVST